MASSKHEPDVSNYSPPVAAAAHRMQTVSASQALQDLSVQASSRQLLTGLKSLDELHAREILGQSTSGVVSRGQITEVYGPPGVGKTALGMQLAANALRSRNRVVWVDCASHLAGRRFLEILAGSDSVEHDERATDTSTLLDHLDHFSTPTLAHLWTLLFSSSSDFPSTSTSLIIIDSISTVFTLAFPRTEDAPQNTRPTQPTTPYKKRNEAAQAQQWVSSRRWAVIGDFVAKLAKLAALRDVAIILLNQTVSRVRPETGAMLLPAVSSNAWDAGVMNRVLLYRDWITEGLVVDDSIGGENIQGGVRFAAVLKAACLRGGSQSGNLSRVVPFVVGRRGLREVEINNLGTTTGDAAALNRTIQTGEVLHPTQPPSSATVEAEEEEHIPAGETNSVAIVKTGAGVKRKRTEVADSASSSPLSVHSGYTDLIGYPSDEDDIDDNTRERSPGGGNIRERSSDPARAVEIEEQKEEGEEEKEEKEKGDYDSDGDENYERDSNQSIGPEEDTEIVPEMEEEIEEEWRRQAIETYEDMVAGVYDPWGPLV